MMFNFILFDIIFPRYFDAVMERFTRPLEDEMGMSKMDRPVSVF